jgi:hypothetical protein
MTLIEIYNLFFENRSIQRRYRITFDNGPEIIGIPTAGSLYDPMNPRFSLIVDDENGNPITSIRTISSVLEVEEI